MTESHIARASAHWTKISTQKNPHRMKWFLNPTVVQHINTKVCGEPIDGEGHGVNRLLEMRIKESGMLGRGVSVGCAAGDKEMRLITTGLVDSFDLFEISETRCKMAAERAQARGLTEKVNIRCENAFELKLPLARYDLVHWNMALHHMLDVYVAIEWSYRMLKPGGWIFLSEYIGPKRFQWPAAFLEAANAVRGNLPPHWLVDPRDPAKTFPDHVVRPNLRNMILNDPSESPDSTNIIPALMNFFPHAEPIMLGGVIFAIALDPLYGAIGEDDADVKHLQNLLKLDAVLSDKGMNLYTAVVAQKRA